MRVGISAIEYALPERRVALEQLESADKLESPAARLREFGFEVVHVSDEPAERLVNVAVARLLENHAVSPDSVDALFYAGAIPGSHFVKGRNGAFLDGFSYPAAKLHYDFGFLNATITGIGQVGCLGLMNAVKAAADFLTANADAHRALCVSADVFPPQAGREVIYNVSSDGACAVRVEKATATNRI